ncbi:DNA-binding LytR/AlgR family response regulator [Pedobacter cryoconitis]|uniref:DNA-binding LytR/AlgR family response regulator n=1 Tax=Pedobacter cryoconitis TaxID=188932 RepID=A0A7W9DWW2_9SPHI|nr:LytTR family DNA-binding domain-containing protein [Pedobacter cryoconitis]MBB5634477.1 DNA-binding LytR/AlgR family response regulator [Pedobacter cryoconitis]MBB6272397.1 DNA-binding LytR/AlgR family response regulator [Pedobacter cryoconitis]
MISCLIIDDEPHAVEILRAYVDQIPFLKLCGVTNNPIEVMNEINEGKIDLIFLDIHMPQISGIDFIKLIQGKCKIILTTAYSEYALAGFENEVIDYLLKPISFERFLKAAQRAMNLSIPSYIEKWKTEDDYMFVKTEAKGKILKVAFKDIHYIEGLKNYVSIFTDTERIIALLNIKDLEGILPDSDFMRVHKSYIISVEKIKAIDGNQIILKNSVEKIPLGETYRPKFFETLRSKVVGLKK